MLNVAIGCFTQFFTPQERDEAGYGERFLDANRTIDQPNKTRAPHRGLGQERGRRRLASQKSLIVRAI